MVKDSEGSKTLQNSCLISHRSGQVADMISSTETIARPKEKGTMYWTCDLPLWELNIQANVKCMFMNSMNLHNGLRDYDSQE